MFIQTLSDNYTSRLNSYIAGRCNFDLLIDSQSTRVSKRLQILQILLSFVLLNNYEFPISRGQVRVLISFCFIW